MAPPTNAPLVMVGNASIVDRTRRAFPPPLHRRWISCPWTFWSRAKFSATQAFAALVSSACLCVVVSWAFVRELRLSIRGWINPKKRPAYEWDVPRKTKERYTKDLGYYAREVGLDIIDEVAETDDGFLLRIHKIENPRQERLPDGRGLAPVLLVPDWTLEELATHDLPAMIDHVSMTTGYSKITLLAHSQGAGAAFIALAQGMRPDIGEKLSGFIAMSPACDWDSWVRLFGVMDFIPLMQWSYDYVPFPVFFATIGYAMFAYLFGWTDANWLLRRKTKQFRFTPTPVSSSSLFWWCGKGGWAARGCSLDTTLPRWFDSGCPPLAIYWGGKDTLIDTDALVERLKTEPDVTVIRTVKQEQAEHCDFYYAADALEWCFSSFFAMSVFQLIAGAQSYDWGKIGSISPVGQYAQCSPGFQLDESKPYAELWMGTHPSMASKLLSSGETLKNHLKSRPELLGDKVRQKFGDDLPFLFKVLAIGKALSIQAHPDKELARRLHAERPDVYKDDNHKPEMAVAITEFSGFCGFLPVETIAQYLSMVEEFDTVVGKETSEAFRHVVSKEESTQESIRVCLKDVFARVMGASDDLVRMELEKLIKRYEAGKERLVEKDVKDVVLELNRQYPADVGIFCVFLLNVVKLEAGQAMFLAANDPHAYIYGDIIECMATSDNVVRAGLTPKLRDVPTLVSMLTYKWGPADSQIMPPTKFRSTSHTTLYDPPIDEFSVVLTDLGAETTEVHEPIDGPSIFIATKGDGTLRWKESDGKESELRLQKAGFVFFIGAGVQVEFSAGHAGLTIYRAFVEA
ncbi:Mannose-6-phosphate isomerase [Tulasnella sp. 332]|nr:Mannose-6-phosphate isomerase [Tulasnella sp. 332]